MGRPQDVNRYSACPVITTYLHACHAIHYHLRSACILISSYSCSIVQISLAIIMRSAMHRAAHHQHYQAWHVREETWQGVLRKLSFMLSQQGPCEEIYI